MGQATTQAVERRGLEVEYTPAPGIDSEQLVEYLKKTYEPILKNASVVILTGEGGRDFLEQGLMAFGAQVQVFALYKRLCPFYTPEVLESIFKSWLIENELNKVILVTSNQSLENLLSMTSHLSFKLNLQSISLVVPSVRIKEFALLRGFERVEVALSARDQDMLGAVTRANLGR